MRTSPIFTPSRPGPTQDPRPANNTRAIRLPLPTRRFEFWCLSKSDFPGKKASKRAGVLILLCDNRPTAPSLKAGPRNTYLSASTDCAVLLQIDRVRIGFNHPNPPPRPRPRPRPFHSLRNVESPTSKTNPSLTTLLHIEQDPFRAITLHSANTKARDCDRGSGVASKLCCQVVSRAIAGLRILLRHQDRPGQGFGSFVGISRRFGNSFERLRRLRSELLLVGFAPAQPPASGLLHTASHPST